MKALLTSLCLLLLGASASLTAMAQDASGEMRPYLDASGHSNVAAYRTGDDWIIVQFKDGSMYLYNHESSGDEHVNEMKRLAARGEGLNAYINRHVKKRYAAKLR